MYKCVHTSIAATISLKFEDSLLNEGLSSGLLAQHDFIRV